MRCGENTEFLRLWCNLEIRPLIFVRVITQEGDRRAGFIENRHTGLEFGDRRRVPQNTHRTRAVEIRGVHPDPIALEIEMNQPAFFPIHHQQAWLAEAGVDGKAMRGVELLLIVSFATEGFEQLARGIKLVDDVGSVPQNAYSVNLIEFSRHIPLITNALKTFFFSLAKRFLSPTLLSRLTNAPIKKS